MYNPTINESIFLNIFVFLTKNLDSRRILSYGTFFLEFSNKNYSYIKCLKKIF